MSSHIVAHILVALPQLVLDRRQGGGHHFAGRLGGAVKKGMGPPVLPGEAIPSPAKPTAAGCNFTSGHAAAAFDGDGSWFGWQGTPLSHSALTCRMPDRLLLTWAGSTDRRCSHTPQLQSLPTAAPLAAHQAAHSRGSLQHARHPDGLRILLCTHWGSSVDASNTQRLV